MSQKDPRHLSTVTQASIIIIIIIIKNECHSNIIVDRLQGCSHSIKLREVKVSHAAVKSFDRRGVSCKNARTVQFQAASNNVQ